MNQCQGKVTGRGYDGKLREYPCAAVLSNGVWCSRHNPAKIAERQRAKVVAKAAPVLLEALRVVKARAEANLGGLQGVIFADIAGIANSAILEAERER